MRTKDFIDNELAKAEELLALKQIDACFNLCDDLTEIITDKTTLCADCKSAKLIHIGSIKRKLNALIIEEMKRSFSKDTTHALPPPGRRQSQS